MTTQNATVAPPTTTAARRYSQQVTALTDQETKEYLVGVALILAEEGGYDTPKEGEVIRSLFDEAIAARYRKDPAGYEHAIRTGRQELARRAEEREQRRRQAGSATAPAA